MFHKGTVASIHRFTKYFLDSSVGRAGLLIRRSLVRAQVEASIANKKANPSGLAFCWRCRHAALFPRRIDLAYRDLRRSCTGGRSPTAHGSDGDRARGGSDASRDTARERSPASGPATVRQRPLKPGSPPCREPSRIARIVSPGPSRAARGSRFSAARMISIDTTGAVIQHEDADQQLVDHQARLCHGEIQHRPQTGCSRRRARC